MQIIFNDKAHNHFGKIVQLSNDADMLIIASAFIAGDLSSIFERMPTIKYVTIYTNLSGYSDGAEKVISLYNFSLYCKKHKIDLLIKSDDVLHGKVYLFYKTRKNDMPEEKGFIITSGNFTTNGLRNNHEYGILENDEKKQKELANLINSIKTYEVTEEQLTKLVEQAKKYKIEIEKLPPIPRFHVDKYVNLKPSKQSNVKTKYYLKPLGTAAKPFEKGRTLKENDEIGFGDIVSSIHRRDVFLCHATGPQMIVGYYIVNCDKQYEHKIDENDRWPYKFDVVCKSVPFSKKWWEYELITEKLREQFLEENPEKHITQFGGVDKNGGDTLGSLNFGSERIEITEEFANFIIKRIPNIQEDLYNED